MNESTNRYEQGILAGLLSGSVSIPYLLLTSYRSLNLSDTEAMLLIHIISFQEREHQEFPTLDDIQARFSASPEIVIKALQKLLKEQFISIDERIDESTGIQYECYNLTHLYQKMASGFTADLEKQRKALELEQEQEKNRQQVNTPTASGDLFSIFEQEFGRPLSPMECETISSWLDQDRYSLDLILTALKEAVFAGKVHFRYIDRILLEWSRNRVFSVEQAKEYTQKFRNGMR